MQLPNRRRILQAGGSALAAAVAGCKGDPSAGSSDTEGERETETGGGAMTGTDTGDDQGGTDANLEPVTVDEEWRMYRADPENTGYTANTPPTGDIEERWHFEIDADLAVEHQPVVANGSVYVATWEGSIWSLDAATGQVEWRVDDVGISAAPAYADGTVYLPDHFHIYAFDAETGEREWTYEQTRRSDAAPKVVDGTIYRPGTSELYALDAATGQGQWTTSLDTTIDITTTPAVADGTVYVGTRRETTTAMALDAETGDVQWEFQAGEQFVDGFTVGNETVYAPNGNGNIYALDAGTGEQLWVYERDGLTPSSPLYHGDTIYSQEGNELFALDTATGERRWVAEPNVSPSQVLTDEGIYNVDGGRLLVVDPADGDLQRQMPMDPGGGTIPVVASGLLFIGGGGLSAYQGV